MLLFCLLSWSLLNPGFPPGPPEIERPAGEEGSCCNRPRLGVTCLGPAPPARECLPVTSRCGPEGGG
jgi:hypothetical protein